MIWHTVLYVLFHMYKFTARGQELTIYSDKASININFILGNLQLSLRRDNIEKLRGSIGTRLKNVSNYTYCEGVHNCIEFDEDHTRLHIMSVADNSFAVYWVTNVLQNELQDCFELDNHNWYGGPEQFEQKWPVEKLSLQDFASVPQDHSAAVVEPYWLNSVGAYIYVDESVPLFVNQNTEDAKNKICFSAKLDKPFPIREKVVLYYTVAVKEDSREAHLHAVKHFLGKPSGHPDYEIIANPIWSTWARYKRLVNEKTVLEFAKEIRNNGYLNGQLEIDDNWEECYGSLAFSEVKFSNIQKIIQELKALNFTVTLWIHPFVNNDCVKYKDIGRKYEFFIKDTNNTDLTQWWNSGSKMAHHLDFTKPEVRLWFTERLRALKEKYDLDGFKFDAGEITWAPQVSVLSGDPNLLPNQLAKDYLKTCANFGRLVEVRTGWRTQNLPIFVRMHDKDSNWGEKNGLYTLITTLLQMNMVGYSMVLPDMVGGNGYFLGPGAELFVRWLQANVFMPSIQFSYVPWDYSNQKIDVNGISKKMVELHEKFAPYIKKQMEASIEYGFPLNSPIWWVDPTDKTALAEDTEFLLGNDVLVAPVIERGAESRSVYLPVGKWVDGNNGTVYNGPLNISEYSAPLDVIPFFLREQSYAHSLYVKN